MASYTVIWDKALESNYIDMWTRSDSETRAILTRVANWVDNELTVDPDIKGEIRPEVGGRVLTVPESEAKVSVVYQVAPPDRKVYVTHLVFRRVS
jgi:hypothetical protein